MKKLALALTLALLGLTLSFPVSASAGLVDRYTGVAIGAYIWYQSDDGQESFLLDFFGDPGVLMLDYNDADHSAFGWLDDFGNDFTLGTGGSIDAVIPLLGDEMEPATVHLTLTLYGGANAGQPFHEYFQYEEDGIVKVHLDRTAAQGRWVTFDGYVDIPGVAHLTGEELSGYVWQQEMIGWTSTTAPIPPGQSTGQ